MEARTVRNATAFFSSFDEWDKDDTNQILDKLRDGEFVSIVVQGPREEFDNKAANICSELVNYGLMYGRDYVIQNVVND